MQRRCRGGPRCRVAALAVLALSVVAVAACGDDGSEESDASGDTIFPDGDTSSPPTAGEGEAGLLTGPGDDQSVEIPGCPDIDVPERLDAEEYELLLAELDCVFEHSELMSEEALAIAEESQAIADEELGSETTDTDEPTDGEAETTDTSESPTTESQGDGEGEAGE